jgi:methylmalonyl-CoA mutase C-terminal domain/subunit
MVMTAAQRSWHARCAMPALQEDVQVVGLSILSGAHLALVPRIVDLLRANGQKDILIFVGGIIPEEDVPELLKMGVHAVYGPGTPTGKIIEEIRGSFSKELA